MRLIYCLAPVFLLVGAVTAADWQAVAGGRWSPLPSAGRATQPGFTLLSPTNTGAAAQKFYRSSN